MNKKKPCSATSHAGRRSGSVCPASASEHRARRHRNAGRGRTGAVLLGGMGILLATVAPGCSEDKPDYEIITLDQARIEKIELTTGNMGKITVSYYSEKRKEEVVGEGLVTEETEILINGAVAKLKDLREGERVRGEVRVEKKGREKKQVAIKIFVDRPKPVGGDGG